MFFFSRVKQKCLDVGILSLEIINIVWTPPVTKGGGGGEDFKILNNEGGIEKNCILMGS